MVAVVTASVLCPAVGAPAARFEACPAPTKPIYVASSVYTGAPVQQDYPPEPIDPPPTDGASLASTWGRYPKLDTDGDGKDDKVTETSKGLDIARGDGTLRLLTHGDTPSPIWSSDPRFLPGDLDGDGHEDLLLYVSGTNEDGEWYALSGATPPGTHELADVGVRLPVQHMYPDPGHTAIYGVVSDHVGGPGPDYLVRNTDGGGLVPGEALLAPGPGGTLDHFPVAIPLPGELRGEFDLGGRRSALLLAEGDYYVGILHLRIWRDGRLYDLDPYDGRGFLGYEEFTAVASPIGRLLISKTTDRGGGTSTAVWNLDRLCGSGHPTPADASSSNGAPPAAPVPAEPSFTG